MSRWRTHCCMARKTAGDSGYTGADKRQELRDCQAVFFIAARPSTIQGIGSKRERAREQRWEHFKASVRAKVEHPFRVIKRQFGYTKVRYGAPLAPGSGRQSRAPGATAPVLRAGA